MRELIKPNMLSAGDTIATITLSWGGASLYPDRYEVGVRRLKEIFGLNVVEAKHAKCASDWLYQNPQARAADLMDAFANPDIKGIFSIIGGDDSILLLPHIDYDVIRRHPKVLLGFSDTTVAHFICLKAGLGTFYGPAILTAFAENKSMHQYTIDNLKKCLFSNEPIGIVPENRDGWTAEYLDWGVAANQNISRKLNPCDSWRFIQGSGKANGQLIGGCVEVLQMINGTEIWPNQSVWENSILFLETSEEGMTTVTFERFLRNLGAQNILQRLNGVLFSKPGGHSIIPSDFIKYDNCLLRVLHDYNCVDLPVVTNMDFGHTDPMMVLPFGRSAQIDVDNKQIKILESGVS